MENKEPSTNNENVQLEAPELEIDEKGNKKLQLIGVMVFVLIALIIAGFSFLSSKKAEPTQEKKNTKIGTQFKDNPLKYTNDPWPDAPKPVEVENPFNEAKEEKPKSPFEPAEVAPKFSPKVYKSSGSFLISTSGSAGGGSDINRTRSWKEQAEEEKGYSNSGVFNAKSAERLNFNPSLFLAKGTYIGCSLNTKLVSTIKGGISCTVSEDVYSENGVTLLIEKGSKISGFFQSGQIKNGVNRIFVVWQEIRTPNHVNIPVFSGATDALGSSGIEGYVDHHWLERFGGAVLISMIDDVFNFVANGKRNDGNGSGNYDYTQNTRQNTQEMATKVLEEFIKIEPTLYKNQGDLVGVYVNRDIDFSSVYRLKVKQ